MKLRFMRKLYAKRHDDKILFSDVPGIELIDVNACHAKVIEMFLRCLEGMMCTRVLEEVRFICKIRFF
jgi:hypothetical protein